MCRYFLCRFYGMPMPILMVVELTSQRSGAARCRVRRLEMEQYVHRAQHGGVLVRRDAGIGVAVERLGAQRAVPIQLRPELDLRREPMLPADAEIHIIG